MQNQSDWKPFSSLQGFIRLILLVDWDPIGIFGYPGALSQYDYYASGVHELLLGHATKKEVIDYLLQTQKNRIGLPVRPEIIEEVVNKIFRAASSVEQNEQMLAQGREQNSGITS